MEFIDAKPVVTTALGVSAFANEVLATDDLKKERNEPMLGKRKKVHSEQLRQIREKQYRRLLPKNPIQLINEYCSQENITVNGDEIVVTNNPPEFSYKLVINGEPFVGYGKKKTSAKFHAYNKAFDQLFIQRNASVFRSFASDDESKVSKCDIDALQTPYSSIISYALYNFFKNYEFDSAKNYSQPLIKDNYVDANVLKVAKSKKNIPRPLPPNAHLMNPTALVNLMRPDAKFIDMGQDEANNFIMKLEIDGKVFISGAVNKKIAKLQCSQLACENIFEISFSTTNDSTTQ